MRSRGFSVIGIVATVLAISLAGAGIWAFWKHYTGLLEENGRTKSELSETRQALQDQAHELDDERADRAALDAVLADRELELQGLKNEKGKRDEELKKLRQRPEVAAWLDAVIPDALLERLRGVAAGGRDGDPSRAPVPGRELGARDAGAVVPRKPE